MCINPSLATHQPHRPHHHHHHHHYHRRRHHARRSARGPPLRTTVTRLPFRSLTTAAILVALLLVFMFFLFSCFLTPSVSPTSSVPVVKMSSVSSSSSPFQTDHETNETIIMTTSGSTHSSDPQQLTFEHEIDDVSNEGIHHGPELLTNDGADHHHYPSHWNGTWTRGPGGMRQEGSRIRNKRSVVQLVGMIRCHSGCNPLAYKSYGCYCGFLGEGKPVNAIDRCCFEHDWCYAAAKCPQLLVYFIPYSWRCHGDGFASCDYVPSYGKYKRDQKSLSNSKKTARCSYDLCECDRKFANCLAKYKCPKRKALCQSNGYIAMQNRISDRIYNLF